MSDFDGLQSRVRATAERLAVAQTERRERNRSLLETLARLEDKFAAQQQEIAFYRERVRPLESANEQLRALMTRLLDMVDAGTDHADDREDPVRIATEMAAEMLGRVPTPGNAPAGDDQISAERFEDVDPETLAAEAHTTLFDDADYAALAAEAANDTVTPDLPEIVRLACAAAQDDDIAMEIASIGEEWPESDVSDEGEADESAADIRALLQRVEAAAARVAGATDAAPRPAVVVAPVRRIAGAA